MKKTNKLVKRCSRNFGIMTVEKPKKRKRHRELSNKKKQRKFIIVSEKSIIKALESGFLRHCKQAVNIEEKFYLVEREEDPGVYILFQKDGDKKEIIAFCGKCFLNELLP